MKRRITIIGAGQAGLQLGIGLVKSGHEVTIYSDKNCEEISQGRVTSSQGMFSTALGFERELGINFWDDEAPKNEKVLFSITNPKSFSREIFWEGYTAKPYQSIDQRIKFPRWIKFFEAIGGNFKVNKVDVNSIETITKNSDLTIVATGKGEIGSLFPINNKQQIFTNPARMLALIYVNNIKRDKKSGVRANIIPGIGEFFIMPGLTHNGYCEMMLFEAIPGGPLDCWTALAHEPPETLLKKALDILKIYLPQEYDRCKNAKPTDKQAALTGGYTPTIKHPVARLTSGNKIIGLGDAIILNDPIAGQGANNASKCAKIFLDRINHFTGKIFDDLWMHETSTLCLNATQQATKWSNTLLQPPQANVIRLLSAAQNNQAIANYLANAFDKPETLFPWIENDINTQKFIEKFTLTNDKEEFFHELQAG